MKLYYTTSQSEGSEQKSPSLSIGGYRSGTQVPNGRLNSLFSDITPLGIKTNKSKYIALILLNDTGAPVTNVTLYFTIPEGSYSTFKIAAVSLIQDSEEVYYMERVQTLYDKPYTGTFYEADGEEEAVSLGTIADDGMIGLWIEQSLLIDVIEGDYEDRISDDDGDGEYTETVLGTEDEFEVVISWT